jgi:flagellar hook-associated protein 1 FlgK
MSYFSIIEIGKRALLAQKFGLDITSNNVSNVNTPGYSRRSASLSETKPISGSFLGTGVVVDAIKSYREEFYDSELRKSISRQTSYESEALLFQRIEALLAEPSESGLNELATEFFNAFEFASLNPENFGLRENLLQVAHSLVDRFNQTAEQFQNLRSETQSLISSNIEEANQLIAEIASLNHSIMSSASQIGGQAQTLIDERELKLEALAKITGINITHEENGAANVFINGINVVTNNTYNSLKLNELVNPNTGERTLQIHKLDGNGNSIGTINPQSGELSAQMKMFNVTLDDKESGNGFSVFKELDDFANAIATKVNAITITGFGLNDIDGNSPARNFFEPIVGRVTAASIKISSDIAGKPLDIPLSSRPNEPGNNDIALKISNLAYDKNFFNNSTPSQFYSGLLGKIGTFSKEALNGAKTTELISEQLNNQRDSLIGVNLDEEAVNIIKYQKAYEAASRIVTVTDSLLNTLINLVR